MAIFRAIMLTSLCYVLPVMAFCQVDAGKIRSLHFLAPDISLLDTDTRIPVDSVINASGFYRLPSTNFIYRPFTNQFHWLKFSVENNTLSSNPMLLILGGNLISECELYTVSNGKAVSLGKAGTGVPDSLQPDFSFSYYYKLPLADSVQDFYLFSDFRKHSLQVVPMLMTQKMFHYLERRAYVIYGIFTGVLLLTAFFNLFLFFFVKDRIHLLYFFYAIANWLLLLSIRNLDYHFLYPGIPVAAMANRIVYTCISLSLCIAVMHRFLGQKKENSHFYRAGKILKWLNPLFALLFVAVELDYFSVLLPVRTNIYYVICLASIVVIIASCIEKIRQGNKLAILYLAAVGTMLGGGTMMILVNLEILPVMPMPPNVFEVGVVVESFIIFLALLYRYNLFKKENERLMLTMQQQKELFAGELLESQEQEQRRFAQDLHDELGGNLAALKMTIQSFHLPAEEATLALGLIDTTSASARSISHNLVPPEFDTTELTALLSDYYLRLNRNGTIRFHWHHSGNPLFNKQKELMIYRIIMELTNNILKHSQATEATIQMVYYENRLEIMVEDNGKGFDNTQRTGLGLKNIQSRINYMSGSMIIDSNILGTTIIIKIPA